MHGAKIRYSKWWVQGKKTCVTDCMGDSLRKSDKEGVTPWQKKNENACSKQHIAYWGQSTRFWTGTWFDSGKVREPLLLSALALWFTSNMILICGSDIPLQHKFLTKDIVAVYISDSSLDTVHKKNLIRRFLCNIKLHREEKTLKTDWEKVDKLWETSEGTEVN